MQDKVSKNKKTPYVLTIIICSALIILSFCGRYFSSAFKYVAGFFLGSFGIAFYGVLIATITICSLKLAGKKSRIPTKYVVNFILLYVAIVLLVHTLTSTFYVNGTNGDVSTYVGYLFNYYDFISFGGVVFGSITYLLQKTLTLVGALILEIGFLLWTIYVTGDFFHCYFTGKISLLQENKTDVTQQAVQDKQTENQQSPDDVAKQNAITILGLDRVQTSVVSSETINIPPKQQQENAQNIIFGNQQSVEQEKPLINQQQSAQELLFPNQVSNNNDQTNNGARFFNTAEQSNNFQANVQQNNEVVRGYYNPLENQSQQVVQEQSSNNDSWRITTNNTPISQQKPTESVVKPVEQPLPKPQVVQEAPIETVVQPVVKPTVQPIVQQVPKQETTKEEQKKVVDVVNVVVDDNYQEDFDEDLQDNFEDEEVFEENTVVQQSATNNQQKPLVPVLTTETRPDGNEQTSFVLVEEGKENSVKQQQEQPKVHQYLEYVLPPEELLTEAEEVIDDQGPARQRAAENIVAKLKVFGIIVEVDSIVVGQSVTRYMLRVLSQKTRMGDFAQYSDDLKACLEATEDIRIEAPVQGTNLVGIEVANPRRNPVMLRSVLESQEFKHAKGKLVFAVGKDIMGNIITSDLAEMPHLFVTGTTGSGKSVALNAMIVSMMYKYGPEYVRFLMVDPKMVELSRYKGIPHMLTSETITDMADAVAGMDYLVNEMEARYRLFVQAGVENIAGYNRKIDPKKTQRMPYIVFIVDEVADLMATNKKVITERLARLAAKSRACGIHMVLAMQRPSTDVISGTIKNNIACRMALKVASQTDSRVIIDANGAEKLLGYGDMLFKGPGASSVSRMQGAYISNDEVRALVDFMVSSNEVYYDPTISEQIFKPEVEVEPDFDDDDEQQDDTKRKQFNFMCKKALAYWLTERNGKASISSLQRGIHIGFNRAGVIYDALQKMGYIERLADSESTKPVKVLVSLADLDKLFPPEDCEETE